MKRLTVSLASLALLLGISRAALAEPINLKQIPAQAKWMAHVDVDAIRDSTVYQKIREKCMEKHPDAAQHLEALRNIIGMNPHTDLHGITLYGTEIGKPKGVLIIHAKVDPAPLLRLSVLAPEHKVVKYGNYEIHTWVVKHHGHAMPGAGAFVKSEGMVIASSVEELKTALDLIDGKGDSLSSSSPLAGGVPAGTTVMARVTGIAEAQVPHKCPLAAQMEGMRFSTGEHNGQSFFRARLTMTNPTAAGQLKDVVDGGRALAQLLAKDDLDKRMIQGLKVVPAEKTLTILWSAPADDVWSLIEREAKKIAARREKMKQMGWSHHSPSGKKPGAAKKTPGSTKKAPPPSEPEI